jgi:hypothetical protein
MTHFSIQRSSKSTVLEPFFVSIAQAMGVYSVARASLARRWIYLITSVELIGSNINRVESREASEFNT